MAENDKRISELQKQENPLATDRIAIERPGSVEAQYIDIIQLIALLKAGIAAGGSPWIEVKTTVLPNATDKPAGFSIVSGPLTFTQTTGPNVVTVEPINVIGWNGTTWSLIYGIAGLATKAQVDAAVALVAGKMDTAAFPAELKKDIDGVISTETKGIITAGDGSGVDVTDGYYQWSSPQGVATKEGTITVFNVVGRTAGQIRIAIGTPTGLTPSDGFIPRKKTAILNLVVGANSFTINEQINAGEVPAVTGVPQPAGTVLPRIERKSGSGAATFGSQFIRQSGSGTEAATGWWVYSYVLVSKSKSSLYGTFATLDQLTASIALNGVTPLNAMAGTRGFLFDFSDKRKMYAAGSAESITEYGTPVAKMLDSSGQSLTLTQTVAAKMPVFVKHPVFGIDCLQFDGDNDSMYLDGQFAQQDFTFVAAIAANSSSGATIYAENVANNTNARVAVVVGSASTQGGTGDNPSYLAAVSSNATSAAIVSKRAAADKNLRIIAVRIALKDGSRTIEMWLDGKKCEGSAVSSEPRIGTTLSTFGARYTNTGEGNFATAYMFGAVGISKALSDAQVSDLMVGLATKYYTPIMLADGAGSNTKLPRAITVKNQKLISTVSRKHGVHVTDITKKGLFAGTCYPIMSWSTTTGDNHSAASILQLSDGRIMAASNLHTFFNFRTRVTTYPNSIDVWDDLRTQSEATMGLSEFDYPMLAEFNGMVYVFGRGWRTADGETNARRNRWYSKLPVGSVSTTNFPSAVKLLQGDLNYRPYLMIKKAADGASLHMLWSSGNPSDNIAYCSIYYSRFRVVNGVETMETETGANVIMGSALSALTPIYDSIAAGKMAWILDITEDKDGRPRVAYVVYDSLVGDGLQSYWTAKRNADNTEWVRAKICDAGGSYLPSNGGIAHAGCVFDTEDCNVIVAGRKRSNMGRHQMTRFISEDDGVSWKVDQQLSSENEFFGACLPSFFPAGTPEPRLTFECGGYYNTFMEFDVQTKLINSINGAKS